MTLKRSFQALLALWIMVLPVALVAQTSTGGVNGTITDPSGAVVQGVTVKLTNQDTQVAAQTSTNSSGYFVFNNVQPGNYVLSVSTSGFKTVQTPVFAVGVNQTVSQSVALAVGTTSEVLEVTAVAPIVQSSSSELGTVIEQKAVQELPLNGRNFTQLLALTPGATPVNTAQGGSVTSQDAGPSGIPGTPVVKPSMNGQQNRSMLFYLDGSLNTDMRGPIYGILPIIDAVQEFKVQSHNDKAEFGGVTGGIVNMVSKSGTNAYHGSAWEFVRNDAFDARSINDLNNGVPRAPGAYRQNEFGATFSGPIQKNKTFFFLAYEGWRYSKANNSLQMLPTGAELAGDFTQLNTPNKKQIYNPYSTRLSGTKYIRDPFSCDASGNPLPVDSKGMQVISAGVPCNKLPASLISQPMVGFLKAYLATPNQIDPTGKSTYNFIDTRPVLDSANNWQVKVDRSFGNKDNAFLRLSGMTVDHIDLQNGTNETYPSRYHAFNPAIGWTHTFSPTLFSDVRFGLLQKPYVFNQAKSSAGMGPLKNLGFTGYEPFQGMFLQQIGDGWTTSNVGNRGDSPRSNPAVNLSANLSWIKGNHNLKTGYEYIYVRRGQSNTFERFDVSNALTQNPQSTSNSGNALATLLLGFPSAASGEMPVQGLVHFSLSTWALYAQDEWKIRPNLTVNIGLRWDVETQPKMLNDRLSNGLDLFNQTWMIGAAQGEIPDCATKQQNPCFTGTNNGGFAAVDHNQNIRFMGQRNFMYGTLYDNIGPRIGFAWEPRKNLVVRGGYSIFYDTVTARSQYAQNDIEAAQWPWVRGFASSPNATTGAPLVTLVGMGAMAGQTTASPWSGLQSNYFDDPNYKDARSQQWNLEIQRQLGAGSMVSIAYVGSKNSRVEYTGKANAASTPSTTNTVAVNNLKAIPWMDAGINYTTSTGWSNYNGLQARYQKRMSKDFNTLISYTWSKSLDTQSGYFNAENGNSASVIQSFFNPRNAYGPSSYNIPHFLSVSTVYEPPFGRGKKYLTSGPMSWLLGNWQVNYIFQIRSGQPFGLSVGGDPANISGTIGSVSGYSRPNMISDPFLAGAVAANPNSRCHYTTDQIDPATGKAGLAPLKTHVKDSYYNQCAFVDPAAGSFGSLGRNPFNGDHVVNMDASLFKNIRINERFSAQLRFEGFNVFNIQNLGIPGTTVGNSASSSTAVITNTTGPASRQLQFGLRLLF